MVRARFEQAADRLEEDISQGEPKMTWAAIAQSWMD
jgi:hypothetical protein